MRRWPANDFLRRRGAIHRALVHCALLYTVRRISPNSIGRNELRPYNADGADMIAHQKVRVPFSGLLVNLVNNVPNYSRTQQKIIRKARRLMIPVPRQDIDKIVEEREDDNWYYGVSDVLLKDEAIAKLRREIRAEQKERFDTYARWITLIVGLIGAATGLVSVWFK